MEHEAVLPCTMVQIADMMPKEVNHDLAQLCRVIVHFDDNFVF
jgi:hypothetical protein